MSLGHFVDLDEDEAALGAVATSNDANGVERRHKQRTQAGIQRLRGGVTIVQSMYVTAAPKSSSRPTLAMRLKLSTVAAS